MSFLSGLSQSIDMTAYDRFDLARKNLENPHDRFNIGTYKEGSQHLLLQLFYEPDIAYHEVPFEGYIADVLNEKGITEIQTVGFRALRDKLAVFLKKYPVTVAFPVSERKRIVWVDTETGESSQGRYSTYFKAKYKLLPELLSVADYFGEPGLSIQIVSMKVSQYKALDGYGKDKKKKATKLDTVPDELLSITVIKDADDIRGLLPFKKGEKLTSADISKALGLRKIPLWKAIKLLTIIEVIAPVGKKGNSIIYEVINNEE